MTELDSQPKSIQSLYSWFASEQLWVNRRYQRKLVWTLEEKQRLVESVLKQYPIPAILLAERADGGYEIIDGLQRVHSLMSFIETRFSTLENKFFNVREFTSAKTRAEEGVFKVEQGLDLLTPREVGPFLDYSLSISIMRGASTSQIDDVFRRINTYGHRLSDQERRQAGIQNDFSNLVRVLASEVRGDPSMPELELANMPSISIDLPKSKHGYEVQANEVFWVSSGTLRSTDLRDSMDEQCVADILASIAGGTVLARSREALDAVYMDGGSESNRIENALTAYGKEKLTAEFKFIFDEIQKITNAGDGSLRDLLFKTRTTNPYPALFVVLFLSLHEVLIQQTKRITNYSDAREALKDLNRHVSTSRGSTSEKDRERNINIISGLLSPCVVDGDHTEIYGDFLAYDVDEALRRCEIEAPHYELKQGLLRLTADAPLDDAVLGRVIETVCAIANNGPERSGTVLIGVADKEADVKRVEELYKMKARKVGKRSVVGVQREATALGESIESYVQRIRDSILNSQISEPLKGQALASLTYSDYYGMGVVVIRVPAQSDVSMVGDRVFVRQGDQTVEVTGIELLAVQKRFQ